MKSLDVLFPYNLKNAVYVPNEFKEGTHSIKNIVFETRKGFDDPNSRYILFIVNLMTVDTITSLPKDILFKEDLAVGKRENQKLLYVDISDYKIAFPKEGIFVVLSLYDQEYYESHGFKERPGWSNTNKKKLKVF